VREVGSKSAICEREWGAEVVYDVKGTVRELEKEVNGRKGGKKRKRNFETFWTFDHKNACQYCFSLLPSA